MVTPMVFDLSLQLIADGVSIEKVYGSPEADLATGELMRVNTLFPSRTEDEAVKGGLVLLKLDADPRGKKLELRASYERRDGTRESDKQKVTWHRAADGDGKKATFANSGIRKGVLLARYADLLVNWAREERVRSGNFHPNEMPRLVKKPPGEPVIYCSLGEMPERGICCPPILIKPKLGKWERTSIPLRVRPESARALETFLTHFESEAKAIGDKTLDQESAILEKLIATAKKNPKPTPKKRKIVPLFKKDGKGDPVKKDDWKL